MSTVMNMTLPDELAQKLDKDVAEGRALSSQERIRQIVALFYSGERLRQPMPEAKGGRR